MIRKIALSGLVLYVVLVVEARALAPQTYSTGENTGCVSSVLNSQTARHDRAAALNKTPDPSAKMEIPA